VWLHTLRGYVKMVLVLCTPIPLLPYILILHVFLRSLYDCGVRLVRLWRFRLWSLTPQSYKERLNLHILTSRTPQSDCKTVESESGVRVWRLRRSLYVLISTVLQSVCKTVESKSGGRVCKTVESESSSLLLSSLWNSPVTRFNFCRDFCPWTCVF